MSGHHSPWAERWPESAGTLTAGSQFSQGHIPEGFVTSSPIDATTGSPTIPFHHHPDHRNCGGTVQANSTNDSETATVSRRGGRDGVASLGRMGRAAVLVRKANALVLVTVGLVLVAAVAPAWADAKLVCRKVVAENVTGEGRNAALGSRVKCGPGEMLTGGTCYAETRPEEDGTCQTSAMGIIQQIVDHPGTTEESFFTCMQTGGTECPVAARTARWRSAARSTTAAAPRRSRPAAEPSGRAAWACRRRRQERERGCRLARQPLSFWWCARELPGAQPN